MKTKTICLVLGVAAFTAADFVEAFEIKQGKWLVTMEMQNPMAPQPQVGDVQGRNVQHLAGQQVISGIRQDPAQAARGEAD